MPRRLVLKLLNKLTTPCSPDCFTRVILNYGIDIEYLLNTTRCARNLVEQFKFKKTWENSILNFDHRKKPDPYHLTFKICHV